MQHFIFSTLISPKKSEHQLFHTTLCTSLPY